ncbi:MAG TPA: hypothetical protein VGN57_01160 [Pirellulaceae bacterium]|jgi:O-acetyl-ADP-ribose deacetylase (regulator of RNase III)|nr:hypothetical protein [Pirellulaceae bacterium]
MPSYYRVFRSHELFVVPGLGDIFNDVQGMYASRLEAALNGMSASGWEFVGTYDLPGEHQTELLIFRHDGKTPVPAPAPIGITEKQPYDASQEPIVLDAAYDEPPRREPAETEPPELELRQRVLHGDLIKLALAGRFDAIVHGCNCRHTMGGGIAWQIKNAFHEAEDADLATEYAAREKLGTLSTATVVRDGREFTVVNAYTQFEPGASADYDAIRSCFQEIKRRFAGMRIGYPRIGAGIGGGDWSVISAIIDEELAGEDHTLVEFQPNA